MNPSQEEVQAIRKRERMQAIRIREGLESMRPHFGWTFGVAAFTLLGFSILHIYSRLLRDGALSRLSRPEVWRTLTVCCVLLGAGLVYAVAWWTTRKVKPPQRAWGVAASLLSLAFPLYVVFVAHKAMRLAEWEIMAYGALALFIYGWPDRWISQALSAEKRQKASQ